MDYLYFYANFYLTDNINGYVGAWVAGVVDPDQYFQVDLKIPYKFTRVHIQGREDAAEWVTSYRVFYSDVATNWTTYRNKAGLDVCTRFYHIMVTQPS